MTNLIILCGLRGMDIFYNKYLRYPGTLDGDDWEKDVLMFKTIIMDIWGKEGDVEIMKEIDDITWEMTRFGAADLHAVGAFLGGVAAQEAIKMITNQFVPLEKIMIYNGIDSTLTNFDV